MQHELYEQFKNILNRKYKKIHMAWERYDAWPYEDIIEENGWKTE